MESTRRDMPRVLLLLALLVPVVAGACATGNPPGGRPSPNGDRGATQPVPQPDAQSDPDGHDSGANRDDPVGLDRRVLPTNRYVVAFDVDAR